MKFAILFFITFVVVGLVVDYYVYRPERMGQSDCRRACIDTPK